jgi:hypothetical protein
MEADIRHISSASELVNKEDIFLSVQQTVDVVQQIAV